MSNYQRYLSVGNITERITDEKWQLDRVSPTELNTITNFSDYDNVVINLTALCEQNIVYDSTLLRRIFDPSAWRDVMLAEGRIIVVGDPQRKIATKDYAQEKRREETRQQIDADIRRAEPVLTPNSPYLQDEPIGVQELNPLCLLLEVQTDRRSLDYRRVKIGDPGNVAATAGWLDWVLFYDFSFCKLKPNKSFNRHFEEQQAVIEGGFLGLSSYSTALSMWLMARRRGQHNGYLSLLPPSHRPVDEEEQRVLKDFFGVRLKSQPPIWIGPLLFPGQEQLQHDLKNQVEQRKLVESQIEKTEQQLKEHIRWFRLLYGDGRELEGIVKEALEVLGALVAKPSKVKEDFRVAVDGAPSAVMEVKGTHNDQFAKGAIRQLGGWMDEVIAEENRHVKGILVGNSGRTKAPSERGELVEHNIEKYAEVKDIVLVRTLDLYCAVILAMLGKLDKQQFWNNLLTTKGKFDASNLWKDLPAEYQITAPAKQTRIPHDK